MRIAPHIFNKRIKTNYCLLMWFYGDWLVKNVKRSQFLVYYWLLVGACFNKNRISFQKDDDVICV